METGLTGLIILQVSIDQSVDDKFSSLLSQVHQCLAGVFEVSLAEEVGRHVEEITSYLSVTITVDASGALLCLQQVLVYNVLCLSRRYHVTFVFSF